MSFTDAVRACVYKYIDWNGRASRSEYWYFCLFFIGGIIVTSIIDAVTGLMFAFTAAFYLLNLLPMLFVTVRRLHDVNKSGWWLFLSLIPLAGLILLYWLIIEGSKGENAFGPYPINTANLSYTHN